MRTLIQYWWEYQYIQSLWGKHRYLMKFKYVSPLGMNFTPAHECQLPKQDVQSIITCRSQT